MPQYIRAFVLRSTFFFTVTLWERWRKLLTEHIDDLRAVFKAARQRRPFRVADWPYSSFHRYVQSDIYNLAWTADGNVRRLEMG
jgi:REP element-mobilizing transposase RayT